VLQALVKGERSELAVELLTELGVDEVVPWEAERCVARWAGERTARRWSASAAAAAKQSRRVHWPTVGDVVRTEGAAQRLAAADLAVVLSEAATQPLSATALPAGVRELAVVVGPEGGISEPEMSAFTAAGAVPRLLGPTVLRASTAGAAAAAVLLAATGRW
jgi:16S rRNA (uracil1498-N3)-methyltransferase